MSKRSKLTITELRNQRWPAYAADHPDDWRPEIHRRTWPLAMDPFAPWAEKPRYRPLWGHAFTVRRADCQKVAIGRRTVVEQSSTHRRCHVESSEFVTPVGLRQMAGSRKKLRQRRHRVLHAVVASGRRREQFLDFRSGRIPPATAPPL